MGSELFWSSNIILLSEMRSDSSIESMSLDDISASDVRMIAPVKSQLPDGIDFSFIRHISLTATYPIPLAFAKGGQMYSILDHLDHLETCEVALCEPSRLYLDILLQTLSLESTKVRCLKSFKIYYWYYCYTHDLEVLAREECIDLIGMDRIQRWERFCEIWSRTSPCCERET